MAYISFSGLATPNKVLEKMRDYLITRGYTLVQPLIDDLNIYDMSYSDGKKLCFKDRTGDYFITLRSANGVQIFGTNVDSEMDVAPVETNINYTGIGMVVSEGYSATQRWYNQFNAPNKLRGKQIYGVFMPIKVHHNWDGSGIRYVVGDVVQDGSSYYQVIKEHVSDSTIPTSDTTYFRQLDSSVEEDAKLIENNVPFTYTLFCNNVTMPTDSLVFTLMKENDEYHQVTHLIFGNIDKFDTWDGGAIFSGSSIKELMGTDVNVYNHEIESDQVILPVLSSGTRSNTFLRINIDEAPTEMRGFIYWASSGTDNETGKKLSMPIRVPTKQDAPIWKVGEYYGKGKIVQHLGNWYICLIAHTASADKEPYPKLPVEDGDYWEVTARPAIDLGNGKIPHYYYLQSQSRLDWGRNVNTLNCITIDLPIFASVLVDPDVLDNYASVGTISGVYCISTLNMQTSGVYEKSYPRSGDLCQIFPHGKRRGYYGFDGISIKQNDSYEPTPEPTPQTYDVTFEGNGGTWE